MKFRRFVPSNKITMRRAPKNRVVRTEVVVLRVVGTSPLVMNNYQRYYRSRLYRLWRRHANKQGLST